MDWITRYLGMVPADWFVGLNDNQKIVFLTQTGVVLVFAGIILWLLLSPRRRVPGMDNNPIPKELYTDLADAVHDVLFDKWLIPDRITPKQYKAICRSLEPKIPGLAGVLYTEAARKVMRVRSQKYNAAQRILTMQTAAAKGPSRYQRFTQMVSALISRDEKPDKFSAAKRTFKPVK